MPKKALTYRKTLDATKQVQMEEQIAATIFDASREDGVGEESAAQLGRDILMMVLKEFRPDLVSAGVADRHWKRTREFHFSVGDSTEGHVGLCAVIVAHSHQEALDTLLERLPELVEVDTQGDDYINVYINPSAFTVDDIVHVDGQ